MAPPSSNSHPHPERPLRKAIKPTPLAKDRALDLRHRTTVPERILWKYLRAGRLDGLKFRRQHPLGPYIADFYCHHAALVVEIDSDWHDQARRDHDRIRNEWMRQRNIHVLRIAASYLPKHTGYILGLIQGAARDRIRALEEEKRTKPPPPPRTAAPPPPGAGEAAS